MYSDVLWIAQSDFINMPSLLELWLLVVGCVSAPQLRVECLLERGFAERLAKQNNASSHAPNNDANPLRNAGIRQQAYHARCVLLVAAVQVELTLERWLKGRQRTTDLDRGWGVKQALPGCGGWRAEREQRGRTQETGQHQLQE